MGPDRAMDQERQFTLTVNDPTVVTDTWCDLTAYYAACSQRTFIS